MFRRVIAGLLLGPALLLASLAWSGYLALNTVLDPDRSQRVADDLYEDPLVREQLASNLATAFESALPEGVSLPRVQVERVAFDLLSDPQVKSLFVDSLVQVHAAFLGEGDLPADLDATPITQAVRTALVEQQPELDAVLPAAQGFKVELPTDRVPNAGGLRSLLQRIVPVLTALALAGVGAAFIATSNRPSVLSRAGIWALSASASVLVIGIGLPYLARQVAPDQSEIVAVLLGSLLEAALTPAITLAVVGAILVVVALIWRATARGRDDAPRRHDGGTVTEDPTRRHEHWNVGPPVDARPGSTPGQESGPVPAAPAPPRRPEPGTAPGGQPDPDRPAVPAGATASREAGAPPQTTGVVAVPRPHAAEPTYPAPRWVEDVGWVQHPDDPRTHPDARWEPGIGYVLDAPPPQSSSPSG